jgi:hypothetical protein
VTFLATLLWPALAASLLLGAGIGWITGLPQTRAAIWSALTLVLVTGIAAGLAVSGLVPGRAGLWVEGGASVLGAYLIGAALAGLAAHSAGARN